MAYKYYGEHKINPSHCEYVKNIYRVSFVSGLIVEIALNRAEIRELIRNKKVSGYAIIK